MTLEEIKYKTLDDNFIVEMKKKLKDKKTESELYSIRSERVVMHETTETNS